MKKKDIGKGLTLVGKGFCMGAADVIPGVSGGTIAFIMGIYAEFLATLSHYDWTMLQLLFQKKWKQLLRRMNLGFLIPVGIGIILAIFSLSGVMSYLLTYQESKTYAVFFGLILASAIWMRKDFQTDLQNGLLLVLGAALLYYVSGLLPVETSETPLAYFFSAMLAICAMILPGISGSFLLLILGKYKQVMELIRNPFAENHPFYLGVFALGAVVGVIAFSKLLHYFLQRYRNQFFAFFIGMMLGSLRKLWFPAMISGAETTNYLLHIFWMGMGIFTVWGLNRIQRLHVANGEKG